MFPGLQDKLAMCPPWKATSSTSCPPSSSFSVAVFLGYIIQFTHVKCAIQWFFSEFTDNVQPSPWSILEPSHHFRNNPSLLANTPASARVDVPG